MALDTDNYDPIVQNCLVSLPGALVGAVQMEFFNVLDSFCRVSNAWQEKIDVPLDPTSVEIGDDVPITPTEGQIFRLLVTLDANEMERQANMPIPGVLQFRELPGSTETWVAVVALTVERPVDSGTNMPEIPDWFLQQYREAFTHGIMGRMMAQPAKPYSNATLGKFHWGKFQQLTAQARTDVSHANRYGANTWAFPRQFATSRPKRGW